MASDVTVVANFGVVPIGSFSEILVIGSCTPNGEKGSYQTSMNKVERFTFLFEDFSLQNR